MIYPKTEEELIDYLGEAIHTAFRKATDCEQAHPIWKLIREMPPEDWQAVLGFVALTKEGWGKNITYGLSKVVEERNNLEFALKETHEMMQSFYGYYSSEFRISTDPPDTEYELRVEQNEKLLGIKSDVSG